MSYQEYEVGAGRVDPHQLGKQMMLRTRAIVYHETSSWSQWVAAAALTLVLLSWWRNLPVKIILLQLVEIVRQFFG